MAVEESYDILTPEESNELFSEPHHKRLDLVFDAIDETKIIVNDTLTEMTPNEFNVYTLPEELSNLYTEIVFTFIKTLKDGTTQSVNKSVLISEMGEWDNTGLNNATKLDEYVQTEPTTVISLFCGISKNHNSLCIYYRRVGDLSGNAKYDLYYLSAWAVQPELTISNENIVQESLVLTDSLCDEDYELHYGKCNPKEFDISIADISAPLKNRWFTALLTVENPKTYLVDGNGDRIVDDNGDYIISYDQGNVETMPIGRFKVYSDKHNNGRVIRDLICYDALYYINNTDVKSWISSLSFPMMLRHFRDIFFEYFGITQDTTDLINDAFSVKGHFGDSDTLLGKTIIESICEFNGVFGHIATDGMFEYEDITAMDSIEYKHYINHSGNYEDYVTDYVSGVRAVGEDGTIDWPTSVGTSANPYFIKDNPIIYGTEGTNGLGTALGKLYDKIKYTSYRPFSLETYGNPVLPVGTSVRINEQDETIESIIMTKRLTGIQAMRDHIDTYGDIKLETIEI